MKYFSSKFSFLALVFLLLLSGCARYNDIAINGVSDIKFKGMKDGVLYLDISFNISNPNPRKIVIRRFEFKAWLNNRKLGTLKSADKVVIAPEKQADYLIPVTIKLRTPADALKLMRPKRGLLRSLSIEGYVKGGRFPIYKKLKIPRQTIEQLANRGKARKQSNTDMPSAGEIK